jgi:hypothetical protein
MIHDTPEPEPRFERFTVRYPSGTVLESYWCIEGGGTLQAVQMEHPLGVVEPDADSLVSEADRT